MLPILKHLTRTTPTWLKDISPSDIQQGPGSWMNYLVEDALVYFGAGLDFSPVRQCNGAVSSFILFDYGTIQTDVVAELNRQMKTGVVFKAHRLIALAAFDPLPLVIDADPDFIYRGQLFHQTQPPFGIWAVYESKADPTERFSFMYMGVEAIQALAALFPNSAPKALVVQEHGFGGSCWQNFSDQILRLSKWWATLPEILILGKHHSLQAWSRNAQHLGSDKAIESMHGNQREFFWMNQAGRDSSRKPDDPRS